MILDSMSYFQLIQGIVVIAKCTAMPLTFFASLLFCGSVQFF